MQVCNPSRVPYLQCKYVTHHLCLISNGSFCPHVYTVQYRLLRFAFRKLRLWWIARRNAERHTIVKAFCALQLAAAWSSAASNAAHEHRHLAVLRNSLRRWRAGAAGGADKRLLAQLQQRHEEEEARGRAAVGCAFRAWASATAWKRQDREVESQRHGMRSKIHGWLQEMHETRERGDSVDGSRYSQIIGKLLGLLG